jgi:hypothetical protein
MLVRTMAATVSQTESPEAEGVQIDVGVTTHEHADEIRDGNALQ